MAAPTSELVAFLGKNGYKAQAVSISRITELQSTLADLQRTGAISADFYPELTKYFNFDYKTAMPEARSIIIIAAPQYPTRILFAGHRVIIPPTYIYRDIWQGQLRSVVEFLQPRGYRAARARVPFKTLAVRSGLGRWGRNNVCYIPGMGSFHRLGAFYSDMPCEDEIWEAPRSMKLCETCTLCLENCPTACIDADRFLIHADRCLTHFNESEKALPGWIKPEWHDALLGCMVCQNVCPLNQASLKNMQDAPQAFDETETNQILAGTPLENLGPDTFAKLESLCLTDGDVYPLLKRNLSVLLNKQDL